MTVPRTHQELDALLARELAPLIERLADEHSVVMTAVCVVENSGVLSVCSCMTPEMAHTALTAALAAYVGDRHEA